MMTFAINSLVRSSTLERGCRASKVEKPPQHMIRFLKRLVCAHEIVTTITSDGCELRFCFVCNKVLARTCITDYFRDIEG